MGQGRHTLRSISDPVYTKRKFIQCINVKPLMCCMRQYEANINVFKCCLNLSLPTPESRKQSGKEFHTDGPTTAKARRAVAFSRQRGTTRSRRLADRSCCRDATLEVGCKLRCKLQRLTNTGTNKKRLLLLPMLRLLLLLLDYYSQQQQQQQQSIYIATWSQSWIAKTSIDTVAEPLAEIINCSLETGIVSTRQIKNC